MKNTEDNHNKEELYSKAVRAGKRTYFFDVKATKSGDEYITLTESKRRFDNDQGKFVYEKHKLFLFKEDFEKFQDGFNHALAFVNGDEMPEEDSTLKKISEVEFDDLDQ